MSSKRGQIVPEEKADLQEMEGDLFGRWERRYSIWVRGGRISQGEKQTDQSGTESRWSAKMKRKITSKKEDQRKRGKNSYREKRPISNMRKTTCEAFSLLTDSYNYINFALYFEPERFIVHFLLFNYRSDILLNYSGSFLTDNTCDCSYKMKF